MNCDEVRGHWNLYHDSEGDAEVHWRVNEHLANCAECAEWFAKQSRFEDLVAEKLQREPVEGTLWPTVLTRAGLARPASSRRWLLFSTLVACAASVLVIAGGVWNSWGTASSASLSSLTAAWHDQLVTGRTEAPFESPSDREVEAYLRREVQFPVRCPPRKDSGFAVRGAGTCFLADQQAAFVVGDVDQSPVSIFILSRESLESFPHQQAALATEQVHRCREGEFEMALSVIDRNLVLVIGRVPAEKVLRVLKAYGTYPHGPA